MIKTINNTGNFFQWFKIMLSSRKKIKEEKKIERCCRFRRQGRFKKFGALEKFLNLLEKF